MIDPTWQWRIIAGSVAVSLALWSLVIARWFRGRPAVLFQPRRAVPWGLVDLAAVLVLLIIFQAATFPILERYYSVSLDGPLDQMPAPQQILLVTAGSLSSLLALAASLAFIGWRTRAHMHDLGWNPRQLIRDGYLGLLAFVMLAVPVFAIQWFLTEWMSLKSKHPLVDVVLEHPRPSYLLCSGFAALIVAPIAEEYLFRVFFQGWLENVAGSFRASTGRSETLARWAELWIYGPQEEFTPRRSEVETSRDTLHPTEVEPPRDRVASAGHLESSARDTAAGGRAGAAFPTRVGPAVWPTLISAGFFALAHYNHGPDPIPLFFLAVGLGYLYQRTHRILPCIAVHFLVNAVTMLQLWLMVSQRVN